MRRASQASSEVSVISSYPGALPLIARAALRAIENLPTAGDQQTTLLIQQAALFMGTEMADGMMTHWRQQGLIRRCSGE